MNKIIIDTKEVDSTLLENKSVIILIGTTGGGKSACANRMVSLFDSTQSAPAFVEGDTSASCTDKIQIFTGQDVIIVDTPGLYDSNGEKADVTHIRSLIDFLQTQKAPFVNAIILVMNGQQERLDRSMKDSVKLFIDSFGHQCVKHLGLIFTKNTMQKDFGEKAEKIQELLSDEMYIKEVPRIPFWGVDCHPERLAPLGVPEDIVQQREKSTVEAFNQIIEWVRQMPQYDTQHASFGCFDYISRVASLEQQYQLQLTQQKMEYEAEIYKLQQKLDLQQKLSEELNSVILQTSQRIESQSSLLSSLRDLQAENAENLHQTSHVITGSVLSNFDKYKLWLADFSYEKENKSSLGHDTPEETDLVIQ